VPGELYKPSSESGLHDCIYKARPDVGAIVHMHSIYVCALAGCRLPLPPAHYAVCELLQTFDFANPLGGSTKVSLDDATVQCASYHTYGTAALAAATLKGLGKNHAVLMANHGAIVVGPDLETAMYKAERLERECEIYWRCRQLHSPPQPLTLEEIRDLQQADESYGQDHPEKPEIGADDDSSSEEGNPEMVETTSDEGSSSE
jgi:L-fuculose-phosphate aldolase